MEKLTAVIPANRVLVDDLTANEVLSRYGVKAFEAKTPNALCGINVTGLELNPEFTWVSIEVPDDQFENLSSLQDALRELVNARQAAKKYVTENIGLLQPITGSRGSLRTGYSPLGLAEQSPVPTYRKPFDSLSVDGKNVRRLKGQPPNT